MHAPSIYDFRKDGILFGPVSDVIPSTPVFEMYPIGFLTMASLLSKNGFKVRVLNLAALMLKDEKLDVEKLLSGLDSRVFGVDLHWMPHAHGSIEVGKSADLVVLDDNLFEMDRYAIHTTKPSAVMMEGEIIQGQLPN